MAKLIIHTGNDKRDVTLGDHNTLGRHPNNSIQILDRIVSKEHAIVERQPNGKYKLIDLKSLNGTFFRGDRVTERILLNGDEIMMGSTRIVFVDENTATKGDHNVTISPEVVDSHIRGRIAAGGGDFLPEKRLADPAMLRRDYERLRIGHELAKSISGELDLEMLLPKILDKAFELVGADRGAILLVNEMGDLVPRFVKTKGDKGEENIVLSRTVLNEVATNKAAVLSSDASVDSRFSGAQSIIMQGIRSTMTLPLLIGEELVGVIHLDSLVATTIFNEKDLQVCTGMAAQAAIAIQNAQLAKRIENEAEKRAQIARLIPPSVVDQVMAGELSIEKGGRMTEITMLYSDIRGFTAMSEKKTPEEVVTTLNEYFEVMVEILFQYNGTLDKFVGDEIIGLFGAPIALENAPYKAVACALAMMRGLEEFNRTRVAENLEPIRIGIGINTGAVITGAIGSTRALQYTAIGDAMNVASRLVSLAKPGEIIISEDTFRLVEGHFVADALPPVKVKGKSEPQHVYRLIGPNSFGDKTNH